MKPIRISEESMRKALRAAGELLADYDQRKQQFCDELFAYFLQTKEPAMRRFDRLEGALVMARAYLDESTLANKHGRDRTDMHMRAGITLALLMNAHDEDEFRQIFLERWYWV